MLSKKLLQFTIAMLLLPALTFAQNTTGSISGSVKADNGEVLVGATISVLHVPTGTVYNAQTRKTNDVDEGFFWTTCARLGKHLHTYYARPNYIALSYPKYTDGASAPVGCSTERCRVPESLGGHSICTGSEYDNTRLDAAIA